MPTVEHVVRAVDGALKAIGFHRRGKSWTRRTGEFHHVVSLQVSKGGDSVTLNIGVFDRACDQLCWGEGERSISDVNCIFAEKIGYFAGRTDVWWKLDNGDTPAIVVNALQRQAIPVFERLTTREAVADALEQQPDFGSGYALPRIYLACLKALLGDRTEALRLLSDIETAGGEWAKRAADVEKRIGEA